MTAPQAVELLEQERLAEQPEQLHVKIGEMQHQAFILYRSMNDLAALPIPERWSPCEHRVDGHPVTRRSSTGSDYGHYLRRIPKQPNLGVQQGIFAPEYASRQTNYTCQVLLTHLAYRTEGHPNDANSRHVEAILEYLGVLDEKRWHLNGLIDAKGTTTCPLCCRRIASEELHEVIDPSQVPGLANSGVQLAETRSTLINLFHLRPLLYAPTLGHTPDNIAWGHAHCNTFLAQRSSYSLTELRQAGARPAVDLFWNDKETFMRAADGRAWVSVTPVPPGTEPFSEFLRAAGLQEALDEETTEDEDA